MKNAIVLTLTFFSIFASAADMMKMNYKNEELPVIIENYSKASGQKFILDPTVRGKVTLLNPGEVTLVEAFNQLSEALALNGFAIVSNGDVMTVRNARSAQRDNIEVFTVVPPAKPQKMVTWIVNLKYVSAMSVQNELRMLSSSYGEISALSGTNQIFVSDWTGNIQRISEMIKKFDVPADPLLKKIVEQGRKEMTERRDEFKKVRAEKPPKPPHEKPEMTDN